MYSCNDPISRRAEAKSRKAQKGLTRREVSKKIAAKKAQKKDKTIIGKEKKLKYQNMRTMKFTEKAWGLGDPSTFQHVHIAYLECDDALDQHSMKFYDTLDSDDYFQQYSLDYYNNI